MRNEYPGKCVICREPIAKGQGFFERHFGKWFVRCENCVGKGFPIQPEEVRNFAQDGDPNRTTL